MIQHYVKITFRNLLKNRVLGAINIIGLVFGITSFAFISCLGLFGLSAFISGQRSKETSIRKVLGTSEHSLLFLISSEYIKLIGISFLVAAPFTWYYTNKWLNEFSYHITLGFIPFILAAFLVISIALLTVFYNTLRVSIANPVNV